MAPPPFEKPHRKPQTSWYQTPTAPTDMGATPPYNASGVQAPESAMRSTLTQQPEAPTDSNDLEASQFTTALAGAGVDHPASPATSHPDADSDMRNLPFPARPAEAPAPFDDLQTSESTTDQAGKDHPATVASSQYQGVRDTRNRPFPINTIIQDAAPRDSGELTSAHAQDSDHPYMSNCADNSWSGTLPSNDDPVDKAQTEFLRKKAMAHVHEAQRLAAQLEEEKLGAEDQPPTATEEPKEERVLGEE